MTPVDPCSGTPAIGTVCIGGAIYAGQFDGGKYMIMPSGCADSTSNPTCSGTDTVTKIWVGTTGTNVDIATLTNLGNATKSPSTERGDVATAIIVAHSSTSSDSAADYCNDMVFGGYSDWALPSKSELNYIYCHSSATSHNTLYPNEDPNCATYGGKTAQLTGFAQGSWPIVYLNSSENSSTQVPLTYFKTGQSALGNKTSAYYIRCARRY